MKKLLFVLTAVLVMVTITQAQKSGGGKKGGLQWGFKLGPNFSSMSGADTDVSGNEKKNMKFGFHFGPFMTYALTSMFYLQADLLFSNQGVVYKDGNEKYTYSTNHLNLPIAIRLQSPGGLYAIVGPQIGFTLGGKLKYDDGNIEEKDDLENLRTVIFSGVVGVGYKLPNGFGAYVRYARAFSSVYDYQNYTSKAFNSVLSLSLFYMMAAKKGAK